MEEEIDGFEELLQELLDDAFSVKKKTVGMSLLRFQDTVTVSSRRSSTLCQYSLWRALVQGAPFEAGTVWYKRSVCLLKPK